MSCILVVEDDHLVRETISDALVDAGYAVAKATDGADALDLMRDHPPDAVLLDLIMPVMDGWAFLDVLHEDEALGQIPVGILSAVGTLRHTAQARGVHVTVGKPFTVDDLLGQVESLLADVPVR